MKFSTVVRLGCVDLPAFPLQLLLAAIRNGVPIR
jgi:hypothetical protein